MSLNQQKLTNVKKIAVLRANALGDFIVTLPALNALKSTYPDAEIILLGKAWHKEFLTSGRTPVDRVIIVPVKKGIRNEPDQVENEQEINHFLQQMQREEFDVVLNFQGNGISANPFIKQFGAKLTVGLTCSEAEKLDHSIDYYYYQSEAIRYIEVVKLIGATTTEWEPQLNVTSKDNEEVRAFKSTIGNKKYVILHPVAMDTRRMWPLENYARLADYLQEQYFEIVFTGSKEDRTVIDDIIYSMNYKAINAAGNFSLGGLTAVLSAATLMISADTGPLHLARSVNTPTIGFYWAPNLINWGPLTRNIHRPMISWKMECPLCGIVPNNPYPFEPKTATCDHPVSFVQDVSIDQVIDTIKGFLPELSKQAEGVNNESLATNSANAASVSLA
jgi:ADP-heptose:LPS heptosyltransferase